MEKPIAFITDMVIATQHRIKTKTRRTKGLEKVPEWVTSFGFSTFTPNGCISGRGNTKLFGPGENFYKMPYQKGDLLWVKETYYAYGHWSTITNTDTLKSKKTFNDLTRVGNYPYQFHAEWKPKVTAKFGEIGWHKRPSVFMPKKAARIWLKIIDVRVERLQDITQEDCLAEGIIDYGDGTYKNYFWQKGLREQDGVECLLPRASFQSLICSINGLDIWERNPWVWVVEFEVVSTTGRANVKEVQG